MRFFSLYYLASQALASVDPDATKSFEEICQENGFTTENYSLTTDDGYILSMYRIPGAIDEQT